MTQVRKAVIPAAGLGTRFLPATKAQPKEMLPVVDKPAIQYVVEEAVRAGIDDILIITGRGKRAIEDHFDRNIELETELHAKGKDSLLAEVLDLADLADIHYVRQGEALGLGHAVSMARKHVGDEPFAVMLGDDIMDEHSTVLRGDDRGPPEQQAGAVVAVKEFPLEEISAYGMRRLEQVGAAARCAVHGIVEKPPPEDGPVELGGDGPLRLHARDLRGDRPGQARRRRRDPAHRRHRRPPARPTAVYGYTFDEGRYDIGNKLDYLRGHRRAGPRPRRPRARVPRAGSPTTSRSKESDRVRPAPASGCCGTRSRKARRRAAPLADAQAHVLDRVAPLPPVRTRRWRRWAACWPRTVASAEDVPPFANTAMDGYAVRAADTAGAAPATPVRAAGGGRGRRRPPGDGRGRAAARRCAS